MKEGRDVQRVQLAQIQIEKLRPNEIVKIVFKDFSKIMSDKI
jgi:hypothetical protein